MRLHNHGNIRNTVRFDLSTVPDANYTDLNVHNIFAYVCKAVIYARNTVIYARNTVVYVHNIEIDSKHTRIRSISNYACLDSRPEVEAGDQNNDDGRLMYVVEAVCGSLKCPPYVDNREIACVVCSK